VRARPRPYAIADRMVIRPPCVDRTARPQSRHVRTSDAVVGRIRLRHRRKVGAGQAPSSGPSGRGRLALRGRFLRFERASAPGSPPGSLASPASASASFSTACESVPSTSKSLPLTSASSPFRRAAGGDFSPAGRRRRPAGQRFPYPKRHATTADCSIGCRLHLVPCTGWTLQLLDVLRRLLKGQFNSAFPDRCGAREPVRDTRLGSETRESLRIVPDGIPSWKGPRRGRKAPRNYQRRQVLLSKTLPAVAEP